MKSHNVNKILCSSIRTEELQLCCERLHDNLKLLFQESERVLPLVVKISTLSQSINVKEGSYQSNISTKSTVHALQTLRAKLAADIETIEKLEAEQNKAASLVNATSTDFIRATVPVHSSLRAEPLTNYNDDFRPSTLRRPYLSMRSPNEVKPNLRTPSKVSSPVIENTPEEVSHRLEPVSPGPPVVLSAESAEYPQTYDDSHETGTQCSSGQESENEETECESEEMDSEDSDYVDDISNAGQYKHHVKAEKTTHELMPQVPLYSTPTQADSKVKRQRNPADRYDPDNIKRIKEEGVYLSSEKLVKENGAWVRQEKETLIFLQNHYNSKQRRWKKVQGKGDYIDQEVIINPNGTGYVLKNNPALGKDYFLSAQDALAYCMINCTPEVPLPVITDSIDVAPDVPQDSYMVNTEDRYVSSDSDSVYSVSNDELPATCLETRNNCSCLSKTDCSCFVRQ